MFQQFWFSQFLWILTDAELDYAFQQMSISAGDDHRKAKLTLDVFKTIYQQEQLKLFYKCTPLHQKLFDVNLPNLPLKGGLYLKPTKLYQPQIG